MIPKPITIKTRARAGVSGCRVWRLSYEPTTSTMILRSRSKLLTKKKRFAVPVDDFVEMCAKLGFERDQKEKTVAVEGSEVQGDLGE